MSRRSSRGRPPASAPSPRARRVSPDAASRLQAALEERRRRAEFLLKDLRSAEPARARAAAQRLAALPWVTPPADVDPVDHLLADRDQVQYKHALQAIAREDGFDSWVALTHHLERSGVPGEVPVAGTASEAVPSNAEADPVRAMLRRALEAVARRRAEQPDQVRRYTVPVELDTVQHSLAEARTAVLLMLEPLTGDVAPTAQAIASFPNGTTLFRLAVAVAVDASDETEAAQLVDMALHGCERKLGRVRRADEAERAPALTGRTARRLVAAHLTPALRHFFAVEIRNEAEGGVSPATLDAALDSWQQADDATLRQWCAPAGLWRYVPVDALPALDRTAETAHLEALVAGLRGRHQLAALLDAWEAVAPLTAPARYLVQDECGTLLLALASLPLAEAAARGRAAADRATTTVLDRVARATVRTVTVEGGLFAHLTVTDADGTRAVLPLTAEATLVTDPTTRAAVEALWREGRHVAAGAVVRATVVVTDTNPDAAEQRVADALAGRPGVRGVRFPAAATERALYAPGVEREYLVCVELALATPAPQRADEALRAWLADALDVEPAVVVDLAQISPAADAP